MKNRIIAIVALLLFLLLLLNIFLIRKMTEISVIAYVLVLAAYLIFFNKHEGS